MTGDSECGAGDKEDVPAPVAPVPIGWQRRVEDGAVAYISPSSTVLSSLEEVRKYLLTDSTCKCGLECPLVLHKVFNFDPAAAVRQRSHRPGKVEEDMTKLCNHRRKVVAMAALCRSMQTSQLPLLTHGTAGSTFVTMESRDPRVGSLGGPEERGRCTYSPRPRLSLQPKVNSSANLTLGGSNSTSPQLSTVLYPYNGSQPLSYSGSDSPELSPLPRKLPPPSPGCPPFSCYGTPPRYLHPPTQNIMHNQRSSCEDAHPLDISLHSSSSSSSSVSVGAGRAGCVGSPSPSGSQGCSPPPPRSRHSSTSSSLSEQGAGMAAPAYLPGTKRSCSSRSPLPVGSPKVFSPLSPKSRLEGMLQQYKESANGGPLPNANSHAQPHSAHNNQSNFQVPDRKGGQQSTPPAGSPGPGAGFLCLPLNQLLNQQKHQQHASPFPASSLLSAAAKAQMASQKSQSSNVGLSPGAQEPAGLISTLHNNIRPTSRPSPSSAPRAPRAPPVALLDKTSRRKRQRKSPTVLSMLKESQLNTRRATGDPTLQAHVPYPDNHLHVAQPNPLSSLSKQTDSQVNKRIDISASAAAASSQPLAPPPAPAPPLSALLHLLGVQGTQTLATPSVRQDHTQCSSPGLTMIQPEPFQSHSLAQVQTCQQQSQSLTLALDGHAPPTSPQTFPVGIGLNPEMGDAPNPKHGQNPSVSFSHPDATHNAPLSQDVSNHVLGMLGQLSTSSIAVTEKYPGHRMGESGSDETSSVLHQSLRPSAADSLLTVDSRDSPENRLPSTCSPGPGPGSGPGPPTAPGDSTSPLQLAESFPFMNQDQLLQLLSANSGLPPLIGPPFLGSLPIGLWMGGQQMQQQQQQQQTSLLNQTSQFNMLPSILGAQGDLPVNLLNLLNPSPPPPPPTASHAPNQTGDLGEKPGLQALLMASLLLSQQQAATMLPLAGLGQLNLDLLLQQQFPPLQDGVALEKIPGLLDSLSGPGLQEALQGVSPPAEGALQALQSVLLPAPLPTAAFLSLSPALLAAALGPTDPPPAPQQQPGQHPQQAHSQVTLPSSTLGSTSAPCSSLMPGSAPDVSDTLTPMPGQGKSSSLLPQLMPHLLGPGVMGDLASLGNISSLLGAGPLLLPPMQAPGLGMQFLQGQAAGLSPLACLLNNLGLNLGPALAVGGEKPMGVHETTSPAPQEDIPASQLVQEPVPSPSHTLESPQQREGAAGTLLDPYSSFMETIYTSFLQVSGKCPEAEGGTHSPPSYPGDPSAPPSLSPRRACSLRNPDLSRLSMEAAQSPARGTPKLGEDSTSSPPPIKPVAAEGHSDPPLPPAFLEEAKTDGASVYPYSNGLLSVPAAEAQVEGQPQSQGYRSPREAFNGTGEVPEQGRGPTVRTAGARRGRKRKQMMLGSPRDIEVGVPEQQGAAMVQQKLERSAKSKRRVFR